MTLEQARIGYDTDAPETRVAASRQEVYAEMLAEAQTQHELALANHAKAPARRRIRRGPTEIDQTHTVLTNLTILTDFTYTPGENGAWTITGRGVEITNTTPDSELARQEQDDKPQDNRPPITYIKRDLQPLLAKIFAQADKRTGLATPSISPGRLRIPQPAAAR